MNKWTKVAVVALVSVFVAEAVNAQGAGRGGRGGGFGGRGGGFGGGFGGPNPIMAALDADQDGTLSASEIANAAAALKKLDKNSDGKISGDEMRPQRGPGGERGERGERGGRGGERGGRGGGFGGGPGGGGSFADRLMEFDENKDGKITASELPERMSRILDRADTNKDGALSKAEIDAMAQNFGGGGGGGFGGNRGGRGGRGGEGGGNRPQRPTRPQ